jgi:putative ABC transport system permease protein
MLLDVVHLLRTLRRSPASAGAAILTLTLTLGAGAAIFAVVDAVLLTPPPFADPDSLVILGEQPMADPSAEPRTVTYATFEAWRERARSLATLEAGDGTNFTLTGLGVPERVNATYVTPGFLPLLGVAPARGRLFDANDVAQRVVIVSDQFWRAKLGAASDVLGRGVVLGGQTYTIVGVMPPQLRSASDRELWIPSPTSPAQAIRAGQRVGVTARLAASTTPEDLAAALDDVSRGSVPPARVKVTRMATAITGRASRPLTLLAGAAILALVIAFTNLAGLLIVRSIDRRRELAVRTALGARQFTIARQLLLEAEGLVVLGIAGGVLVAFWATPVVGRLALQQFGGLASREIDVSWRVIGFVSAVALGCAGLCGLIPAWTVTRGSLVDALRRRTTSGPRELILRRAFVICEVALAFVLLVSMTLLGRSLVSVLNTSPGFEAHGVITRAIALPAARYSTNEQVTAFYANLHQALSDRLGRGAVSLIDELPLSHDRGRALVNIQLGQGGHEAVVRVAASDYFEVMRVPVIAGRGFGSGDDASAPFRVVLSASLARQLFGSEAVVGRRVWITGIGQPSEVIGVVGDVKLRALDDVISPTLYQSYLQFPSRGGVLVVRTDRPQADAGAILREAVARLDPDLPLYGRQSMEEVLATSSGVPVRRVLTAAFSAFALLAVALGAIGLFGVVAHDVASRRPELALRIALGAAPTRILNRTLGQGGQMVVAGLAIGGVLSIWTARLLSTVIGPAARIDVVSVAAASLVLLLAGAAATLPAARRAARTDPLMALRSE